MSNDAERDPNMDGMLPTPTSPPQVLNEYSSRINVGYKILEDGRLLLAVPKEQQPVLITILNRALNCWPECPPEWKRLADILIHGAPLVDYYAQEASTKMRHTNKGK